MYASDGLTRSNCLTYLLVGGCFVEGDWLRNAFRWKETIGPWEERPGHFGDVWNYWTDDGLGHLEYLQVNSERHVEIRYLPAFNMDMCALLHAHE